MPQSVGRHYRSKSVDATLPAFQDIHKNDTLTKDDSVKGDDTNGLKTKDNESMPEVDQYFKESLEETEAKEEEADDFMPISSKPSSSGSYLKRFLQQFSEGSFNNEDEDRPKGKLAVKNGSKSEKSSPIRKKVDDICKKCMHYKGQINPNQ